MKILIFATAAVNTEKGIYVCRAQLQAFTDGGLVKQRQVVAAPFDNGRLDTHRTKLSAIVHALHVLDKARLAHLRYALMLVTNYEHAVKIGRGVWKRNANLDLWRDIDSVARQQTLTWVWVSSGSKSDDRALLTESELTAFMQFTQETQALAHV